MSNHKKLFIGVILFSVSTLSVAGLNCSTDALDALSPSEQIEKYGECASLMDKKIELLKKSKKINEAKADMSPGLNSSLPSPQPTTTIPKALNQVDNRYPQAVVSYDDGVAKIAWSNGRTMSVSKNSFIADDLIVVSVSSNGIEIKDTLNNSEPVFIGFGTTGQSTGLRPGYGM